MWPSGVVEAPASSFSVCGPGFSFDNGDCVSLRFAVPKVVDSRSASSLHASCGAEENDSGFAVWCTGRQDSFESASSAQHSTSAGVKSAEESDGLGCCCCCKFSGVG